MSYQLIENFNAGQDDRRADTAAPPGTLRTLTNAHITRGGEIEKRKALVSKYALPAGETHGLAAVGGALYVFGSVGGFSSGTITMTTAGTALGDNEITAVSVNGKTIWSGSGVGNTVSWTNGDPVSEDTRTGFMSSLANFINASALNVDPVYTAVAAAEVVTLTTDEPGDGPDGYVIAVTKTGNTALSTADFSGGVAIPSVPDGVNYQFLEHPDADQDLYRVLSADTFDGKVYAIAEFDDASVWHYYDAELVEDFVDNRARGSFTVGAGTVGVSTITSITVDSVEVLGRTITYGATAAATAEAIGTAINAYASVPRYTATVQGAKVFILADSAAGTGPNGFVVGTTTSGITISGTANMAGGTALAAGTFLSGRFNRTFRTKMYTTAGATLRFSNLDDPTTLVEAGSAVGAGSINMSSQASGSEELVSISEYYSHLAVFSRNNVQTWTMDPDPELNTQVQVLRNTGTYAPRAVESLGDGDVIYLSRTGVRSLRARDSSNAAVASEIGAPLDNTIIAYAATLSAAERESAVAIIEPIDNRYWLALGDKVYVLSLFTASRIAAWSEYDFGFSVSDLVALDDRVYARSGDTVYLFGGDDNDEYDDSEVTVILPFADGSAPATFKELTGIDATIEGEWHVYAAFNPKQPTEFEDLGIISGPTWGEPIAGAQGESTHFKFKLVHEKAEYARLSNFAYHFNATAAG